ncbi:MAG TPA: hypothetical protein VMG58_03055 [Candidatus Sulfotelmatobacter sp.]|nr:hypothetical protein [Candidatus Sulfotelmatobacter sp.]
MSRHPKVQRDRGRRAACAILCGLLALIGLLPAAVSAREDGTVVKQGVIRDDLYVSGGDVDVQADVQGDLVAAGGHVSLSRRVQGDATLAGGDVTVSGEVVEDVRAAGGQVGLEGPVGGGVMAAGGRITLARSAQVGKNAWLAGGVVDVDGHVGRRLRAAGKTVRVSGEVDGNADLAGITIEILPTARIHGNLTYRSPGLARIDPGARVDGDIVHRPASFTARLGRIARIALWVARAMFFLGLVVTGILLILLFPDATRLATATVASDPGKSVLLGLVLLLATPIVTVVLLVSLLGIPLGLTLLALFFLWLLFGVLTGVMFLGDLGARLVRGERSRGWRVLFFLVALLALGLLGGFPLFGALLWAVALLVGLGAWTLALRRRYTGATPRPAGTA